MGVSFSAIGNYESGSNTPRTSTIVKLSVALGTSSAYLLGETDEPTPSVNQQIRSETPIELDLDRYGRPRFSMHKKTLEKAQVLQEELGCLTIDEVVAKVINDRFDQIPGVTPEPEHIPVLYAGMATKGHNPPEEDEDDEVYDVDMTKPRKPR